MAVDYCLTPPESCEKILHQVMSSNLHFILQESPFSIYLTVRKKFVGNSPKPFEPKVGMDTDETRSYLKTRNIEPKEVLVESLAKLSKSESCVKILENKVEHAEKEVLLQMSSRF